jgi:hypothetical protein
MPQLAVIPRYLYRALLPCFVQHYKENVLDKIENTADWDPQ